MEEPSHRQFGPYRVVGALGEGGMATVYKAFQPAVNRYVALKVLSRAFIKDPQFLQRFRHEARILAQLQHPHILPIFDFGESEGYAYLAMPFINGGTLAAQLRGRPLSLNVTVRAIQQICDGLTYAHSKGIVHRDIKPSNVLVDESGNCLLADFGIAHLAEGATKLTQTGMLMGTPEYMSPEQASGEHVGPASDIYSVGILLYELATGRVPYKAETPVAVAIKHLTAPLPPPRTINPALYPEVEAVVLKALAKVPAERFSSAADLAVALSHAAHSAQSAHESPTVLEASSTTEREGGTDVGGTSTTPRMRPGLAESAHVAERVDAASASTTTAENLRSSAASPTSRGVLSRNSKAKLISAVTAAVIVVVTGILYQSRSGTTLDTKVTEAVVSGPTLTKSSSVEAQSLQARSEIDRPSVRKTDVTETARMPPQADVRNPPAPPTKTESPLSTTPSSALKGTLLVMCDRDCSVSVDGRLAGQTTAGRSLSIPTSLGQHVVRAISGNATWEQTTDISTGGQLLVRTDLATEVDRIEAQQAEQRARDRWAELAAQQRQEQMAREGDVRRDEVTRERSLPPSVISSSGPAVPPMNACGPAFDTIHSIEVVRDRAALTRQAGILKIGEGQIVWAARDGTNKFSASLGDVDVSKTGLSSFLITVRIKGGSLYRFGSHQKGVDRDALLQMIADARALRCGAR
jgi:serine/threonine protein kinase